MQIGEMLVRAKALTPADLDEAISWQVLYGGRLGTNILELGLCEEKTLAEALGKQLACEWTCGEISLPESMVQAIPPVVARRHEIVPWKVDGKKLKVLCIAPSEALPMFDELGFRLGKTIRPVVAPEFRIHQLLRRYFDSVRQMRALDFGVKPKGKRAQEAEKKAEQQALEKSADLMDDDAFAAIYAEVMEGRQKAIPAPPPAAPAPELTPARGTAPVMPPMNIPAPPPAQARAPNVPATPPGWNAPPPPPPQARPQPPPPPPQAPPPSVFAKGPQAPSPHVQAQTQVPAGWNAPPPPGWGPPAAPPPPKAPVRAEADTLPVMDASTLLRPISDAADEELPLLDAELIEDEAATTGEVLTVDQWAAAFSDLAEQAKAEEPAAKPPEDLSPLSFKEAVAEIGKAEAREGVARAVLRYARSKAARAVLLNVQGDVALGWDAVGEDLTPEIARKIAFPINTPSAFKLVRESRSHYIGPLGKEAGNVRFLKLAGKKWPASAVLLPVLFRGKVVYILYVDNGHKQQVNPDVGELLILSQNISRSMEQMVAKRQAAAKK